MPFSLASYLAVVQFLFALCWIVYVIYLPALLESAGLPRAWTPWLLALDQAIFASMDLAMGLAADRIRRTFAAIAPAIAVTTLISCFAFLLLPYAGAVSLTLLLVVVILWATAAGVAAIASSLELTVAAQLVRGGAWGAVLMAACSAALCLGLKSREGLAVGLLWSGLACAALLRFAMGLMGLPKVPAFSAMAPWIPTISWMTGALLFFLLPRAARRD